MKLIGITGGVGSGKSEVLTYIRQNYNARILLADDAANHLKEPGQPCYEKVVECLGKGILKEDGSIDRNKMAAAIFEDDSRLGQINAIMHPAVKKYILQEIANERKAGEYDFFFLEAALLIEEHYDEIVDELWFIYAKEEVRRKRLMQSRHYSDAKIDAIISKQLSEEQFKEACSFIIDNSDTLQNTQKQIDQKMGVYLCKNRK